MTSPAGRPRFTLPRARRLKRQRLIRALFDRQRPDVRVLRSGALLARYRVASTEEVGVQTPVQVGFATGRHLRTKPARNRVKRVMREVFRVHQHALVDLFSERPGTLTLMLLYRGQRDGAEASITRDLPEVLRRLAEAEAEASPEPSGKPPSSTSPE